MPGVDDLNSGGWQNNKGNFTFTIIYAQEGVLALCKKASNHHANRTPGNVQFYIVTTWETPGNHWCWWLDTLIIARALARVIIKVFGHQHQWFPGVSQVVTM